MCPWWFLNMRRIFNKRIICNRLLIRSVAPLRPKCNSNSVNKWYITNRLRRACTASNRLRLPISLIMRAVTTPIISWCNRTTTKQFTCTACRLRSISISKIRAMPTNRRIVTTTSYNHHQPVIMFTILWALPLTIHPNNLSNSRMISGKGLDGNFKINDVKRHPSNDPDHLAYWPKIDKIMLQKFDSYEGVDFNIKKHRLIILKIIIAKALIIVFELLLYFFRKSSSFTFHQ